MPTFKKTCKMQNQKWLGSKKLFYPYVRWVPFKQLYELTKLTKRMYQIVHKDPRRFYQSERFFF